MIHNYEEVTLVELGVWEVLVRVVPPTASYRWQRTLELPPKPPPPVQHIPSVAGHIEEVRALPETAEYDEWAEAMRQWDDECNAIRDENLFRGSEFAYDVGLVAWRLAGSDDEWMTQPPDDWELTDAYDKHGVETRDDRRLEFILNVLLNTEERLQKASAIMYPARSGDERDLSPIRQEEVDAAVALFRPGDEIPRAAGRLDTHTAQVRGEEHTDVKPGERPADGGLKRLGSRLLGTLQSRG